MYVFFEAHFPSTLQILFLEYRGFKYVFLPETSFLMTISLVESNKVNYETLDHFPVYLTTKWQMMPICSRNRYFLNFFEDSEDEID